MKFAKIVLAAGALSVAPFAASAADLGPYGTPPGPPVSYKSPAYTGCFATFTKRRAGRGPSLSVRGPIEDPNLNTVHYGTGADLNNGIGTVSTGPSAWIVLYGGRNYRRPIHRIGPNRTFSPLLRRADSYRLYCTPPADWAG